LIKNEKLPTGFLKSPAREWNYSLQYRRIFLELEFWYWILWVVTNTCLRPVEEDLSMSACIEHSASNL
jgi:hypothetical protein